MRSRKRGRGRGVERGGEGGGEWREEGKGKNGKTEKEHHYDSCHCEGYYYTSCNPIFLAALITVIVYWCLNHKVPLVGMVTYPVLTMHVYMVHLATIFCKLAH